jgi:peptidoglycan/LPS O-acetylase OafA/YrhL
LRRRLEAAVSGGARPAAIDALTGVRALAAVWVVLFHVADAIAALFPGARVAMGFLRSGYLGVDLFFVLSGFVISLNYMERFERVRLKPYLRFVWLRLARIYPVHALTLGMRVALVVGALVTGSVYGEPAQHRLGDLVQHALLVQGWFFADHPSWNVPSWSLSAEWMAYLAFPWLAVVLLGVRRPAVALGGVALAYLGLLIVAYGSRGGTLDITFDGGLYRIAAGFTAGCLLYRVHRAGWGERLPWDAIAAVTLAAITVLPLVLGPAPWITPLFALLIFALARAQGPVARLLASPLAMYGGRISYALYLVQGIVIPHLLGLVPFPDHLEAPLPTRVGLVLLYVIASWPIAHVAHVLVEERCRKAMARLVH